MTDTANPTPGPYEIRVGVLHKLYSKSARLEILTADQVSTCNVDGHYYSVKGDEANKNIHLAKDAFEVFQETNLTPRQLLEQRDELLLIVNSLLAFGQDNEATDAPWWAIVKNSPKGREVLKAPFLSRPHAEEEMEAGRHNYGSSAYVYCFSGSRAWRTLLTDARAARAKCGGG
jgi:hypothetical protein